MCKTFFQSIAFLTTVPVPASWTGEDWDLQRSVRYFPVVGLLIGFFTVAAAHLLPLSVPPLLGAVLLTGLWALLSGGLHLDGLADTADGFFSHRDRERMLEIMKDSTIGAMGVLALVFVLLLKVAALHALLSRGPEWLWPALLLAPVAGRVSQVLGMSFMPYARPESGLGKACWNRDGSVAFFALGFWAVLLGGVVSLSNVLSVEMGMALLAVLILLSRLGALYSVKKIGGGTGDILGALSELTETLILVTMVVAV